jgi:hypothetical protein
MTTDRTAREQRAKGATQAGLMLASLVVLLVAFSAVLAPSMLAGGCDASGGRPSDTCTPPGVAPPPPAPPPPAFATRAATTTAPPPPAAATRAVPSVLPVTPAPTVRPSPTATTIVTGQVSVQGPRGAVPVSRVAPTAAATPAELRLPQTGTGGLLQQGGQEGDGLIWASLLGVTALLSGLTSFWYATRQIGADSTGA